MRKRDNQDSGSAYGDKRPKLKESKKEQPFALPALLQG
jgi:hypothetical protein